MDPEIVNIYIERLLNEVAEGAKSRILLETRLKYTESINVNLSGRIQQLEAQLEKQNKKITKKEVNTSDTF
jgi:CII-binding regulator of phage lambda lysogenization HflD